MLAAGGKNFEYHRARDRTEQVLASRDWDVVVLQSHSLDPVRNRPGVLDAGRELALRVREAGAEPVLFETWPREDGNAPYRFGRVGYTPDEMLATVHDGYHQLPGRIGAEVGAAWRSRMRADPDVDLYASDSNHPARLGSARLGSARLGSARLRHRLRGPDRC